MGLVGPNGAGKTTLLRILAGVMPIDEGQIKINDLELSKSGEAVDTQLRTLIGHMPEQVDGLDKQPFRTLKILPT